MRQDDPADAHPPGLMFQIGFWWLVFLTVLFIGWGVVMAVAPENPIHRTWRVFVQRTYIDGQEPASVAEMLHFLMGMLGAAIMGFYVLQLGILLFAFRQRQRWAWWTTLIATLAALTLDSTMSVVHGAVFNVWFNNLIPAIGYGIPLALTAPEMLFRRSVEN